MTSVTSQGKAEAVAFNGSVTMIDGTRRRFEYAKKEDVGVESVGGEQMLFIRTTDPRVYYFPVRRIDFIDLPAFDGAE